MYTIQHRSIHHIRMLHRRTWSSTGTRPAVRWLREPTSIIRTQCQMAVEKKRAEECNRRAHCLPSMYATYRWASRPHQFAGAVKSGLRSFAFSAGRVSTHPYAAARAVRLRIAATSWLLAPAVHVWSAARHAGARAPPACATEVWHASARLLPCFQSTLHGSQQCADL